MILDGEHGFDHSGTHRGEGHRPPLLAFAGDDGRQDWCVEREPFTQLIAELEPHHVIRKAERGVPPCRRRRIGEPLEADLDDLPLELRRPRDDRHGAADDRELAGLLRLRALGVAEIVQTIDELLVSERLAAIISSGRANTCKEHLVALWRLVDQPKC
jgi:hypothetical protein